MPASERVPAVGVHFFRVPTRAIGRALWRMAVDRRRIAVLDGLEFAKLLGTGDGRTFDLRDADLRTWGLLTVWRDPLQRAAFERSEVIGSWSAIAEERWSADLLPVKSAGAWSGRQPFTPVAAGAKGDRMAVVAITRARLRPRRALEFWRAVPPVTGELRQSPGLLLSIGIGEAPLGLQGTFSLWRDEASLRAFAYARPHHRDAIRRTHQRDWYVEELFARFAVTNATGSLWGTDPLRH